jgi:ASC-1-like (ASCH) protein
MNSEEITESGDEGEATTPTAPGLTAVDMGQLGAIIAQGIAQGIAANQGPKKVTFGQYDPRSPFHPNKKTAAKLTRVVFQNGRQADWDKTSDAEIRLLNKITRSGRYISRRVEVILRDDAGSDVLDIRYNNMTVDQRMENARHWHSFEDMLKKILMEQEIADENDAAGLTRRANR